MKALILGGASDVWSEVTRARALFEPDAFFLINDMIALWPERADYFVSLHPEKCAEWLGQRAKHKLPMSSAQMWCHKNRGPRGNWNGVDRTTPDWGGSSGLFAVKIAIEEGFSHIVLCGVPLRTEGKHVVRQKPWAAAGAFRNAWKTKSKQIGPYTRSMSGWTQELLGEPTVDWLQAA